MQTQTGQRRSHRRGNALVLGLGMGTLLGFSALAVDLGMVTVADSELQVAIDAAALGGIGYLDGTQAGIDMALEQTTAIAALNAVLQQPLALRPADVMVGIYAADAPLPFRPYLPGIDDPKMVNALRVEHSPPDVQVGIARAAFGHQGVALDANALAVREPMAGPAKNTNCFLPIAVSECSMVFVETDVNPPPMKLQLDPHPNPDLSWAQINGNPSTSGLLQQFSQNCDNGTLEVGDTIHIDNTPKRPVVRAIANILNDVNEQEPSEWPEMIANGLPLRDGSTANTLVTSAVTAVNWGNVIHGPVPIVDFGCLPEWEGVATVTGLTYAVIFDASISPTDPNLFLQVDINHEYQVYGDVAEESETSGDNVQGYGEPTLVSQ